MRFALFALPLILGTPAMAHPGHLVAASGHDHWVAGTAIGLAVVIGIWGALKGRKEEPEDPADAVEGGEEQAA